MTEHPRRAVAVAAWAGSTNLGDELVLAALLAKLAARGIEPLVASVDPPGTASDHRVEAAGLAGTRRGLRGRPAGAVLGGGGLLQDETSPFNLPFHLGRALVLAGRRPLAGVGLGAGPLTGSLGTRAVSAALSRTVGVSVRDAASAGVLAGLGVPAVLAADLAVSLPLPAPDSRPEVEGRSDRLAVSLRPWSGGGGLLPVSLGRRGRRDVPASSWFASAMAAALDAAAGVTGLAVHFVALQAVRDGPLHESVATLMRTPSTSAAPDVHSVVEEIASCRAVVAMRYHAGIAALLGGRPAVLLDYSPKVGSLAEDVPDGFARLRLDPTSVAELPDALGRTLRHPRAVVEGRDRLRHREAGNDEVLDRLVEAIDAGR